MNTIRLFRTVINTYTHIQSDDTLVYNEMTDSDVLRSILADTLLRLVFLI